MRLSSLAVGERGNVINILAEGEMRRRLIDIGLIEETVVSCIGRSPLGDPSAYLIRGAVIALRDADADTVLIEREG